MKITILATGTRGDVQPFVALGLGLQQAGYQVGIVSNSYYEAFVRQYRLNFHPLHGDIQAGLQTELGQKYLGSGNLLAGLKYFVKEIPKWYAHLQAQAWQACQHSTCLIYSLIDVYGYDIAQKLGVPAVQGHPQPFIPTRAFPPPSLGWPNLGGPINKLTYPLSEFVAWHLLYRQAVNKFRRETLGLPPTNLRGTFYRQRKQEIPALMPFSPVVISRPIDWPGHVHLTGFWFLPPPPDWQPPASLLDFMNSGPPPVYIGFGSMANRKAAETTELVLEALKLSGQRGILATGWGGLNAAHLPDDVLLLEAAPHHWLFPQMKAVVHHGGAGTTAAGLQAGIPSVLVPHFQDQFFWGQRVQALGVGPAPIPRTKLTAKVLAQRITAATHQTMQERAARVGRQIRAEDGIGAAIAVIRRVATYCEE